MGEIKLNSKIYPLDIVFSACYVFLDRAYILLDGDPENEIIVKIDSKDGEDIKGEFMNELINYSEYNKRAKETKPIREMLLQRAIITNDALAGVTDDSYLEDPEDIAVPWEEKYGKKDDKTE